MLFLLASPRVDFFKKISFIVLNILFEFKFWNNIIVIL